MRWPADWRAVAPRADARAARRAPQAAAEAVDQVERHRVDARLGDQPPRDLAGRSFDLSGFSTTMFAYQDQGPAPGGPGLANYLSLRLQQMASCPISPLAAPLQTRPAMGGLIRCGRPARAVPRRARRGASARPGCAGTHARYRRAVLAAARADPTTGEPTAKDRPGWPRGARPPSRPAARSSAIGRSAISPRRASRPGGKVTPGTSVFVVHKHAARRLHYDLRLQVGDTLKSWAVPKGPSLDPRPAARGPDRGPSARVRRLRGLIPEGEYGGGPMIVWDRGTWAPMGDAGGGLSQGRAQVPPGRREARRRLDAGAAQAQGGRARRQLAAVQGARPVAGPARVRRSSRSGRRA